MLPLGTSKTGFSGSWRSGVSRRTSLMRLTLARDMVIMTTSMLSIMRLMRRLIM